MHGIVQCNAVWMEPYSYEKHLNLTTVRAKTTELIKAKLGTCPYVTSLCTHAMLGFDHHQGSPGIMVTYHTPVTFLKVICNLCLQPERAPNLHW
jgi:hypothetical protein